MRQKDVEALEQLLAESKERFHNDRSNQEAREEFMAIKRRLVRARSKWRTQEELAGRRMGLVGGDAVRGDQ